MIAACPKCTARYRVDESRIGPEGAKLKCAKCQALFRVLAPPAPEAAPSPQAQAPVAPEPAAAPAVQQQPSQRVKASPPSPGDGAAIDRDRLVVVADSNEELGKATVAQLSAWGLQAVLVHDGVEAMLTIQRMLPRAVVLDAALPKMYGFQVCEVIKRNESLQNTGVILVAAIHNRDRYRRQPVELYGADYYIEQPDLPEGLGPLFEQMGLSLSGSSVAATPAPPPTHLEVDANAETQAPPPAPAPVAAAPPQAAPTGTVGGGGSDAHEAAERLARIIVSDIALYQPEKFAEGIRSGNVVEVMDNEIGEGRILFAQRIDESIREERDFIVEELLRVARERGME
jgi:predicted Zn finger-like uncharacterized protein